ncbi:MAG: MFS transporter [Planctomycetes bacterium]|nr:MFS transporter [Planctomycetota bacterium]
MSIRREHKVQERFERVLAEHQGADPARTGPLDAPIVTGSTLTRRNAVRLFEAALQSRLQDLEARRMKDEGRSYYTIGSSGHEANVVFGHLLRTTDPALLHYRSGAFMAARARRGRGETPIFDTMLSFAASAEDPISGGRHKVFGSRSLWVPPQTSTIASHLPKAFGMAFVIARLKRLALPSPIPDDSIVYCSFGDASSNHATGLAGFNAAASAALQRQPCPVIFACEDNGIGISTKTPQGAIERRFRAWPGLTYFGADGRDLAESWDAARTAIEFCRRTRQPVFFHLRTVRLMGHAGSDVETVYRSEDELERTESQDPLIAFAELLLGTGAIEPAGLRALYEDQRTRIARAGAEASRRRKITSAAQVGQPLELPRPESLAPRIAPRERRLELFGGKLPEDDPRPRHLAFRISQALKDLLAAHPEAFLFGEDVARKGGVYHVTTGLFDAFGAGRVFNTILDETTILGLAQAFGTLGCLPFPEIQYLAYVHNALDQIRGEAASLQFFSEGRFANPMVVRIAGYAYQKGFGGHFHNDNSVGALLDIPGLIIASPARGDDAVGMLRTCAAAAIQAGKVCLFIEPIALYMTKDLHTKGDGLWECRYPPPSESVPLGEPRAYVAEGDDDLLIVSWANGAYMSLQAREKLAGLGIRARVLDLRWLAPLPIAAIKRHAQATGRVLVVDECRTSGGGPSAAILAALAEDEDCRDVSVRRITGIDSYVPLAEAANLVLVQPEDVIRAAQALCSGVRA